MTTLGSGYELLEPIGGGAANVFRARSPSGDEVAVKLLTGAHPPAARFERACGLLEALDHPHLVRVLASGVDPERGPWLAMPLVRGMTLRDLYADKSLCPEAALLLLVPLVEALSALHEAGLVHGDVRPESFVLSPLGDATLLGLGVALADGLADGLAEADERPREDKETYLAPEVIEGRALDPASDVWAVGVLIYELIAGRRPFERDGGDETRAAILSTSFTPLRAADRRVSAELDWLVGVCLAKEPWNRPRDARALLERMTPLIPEALDRLREARVSVLSDAAGYERRVGEAVSARARSAAEAALRAGDGFEALRVLDRALAYRPDDAATLALVERAGADPDVASPGAQEPAPTSHRAPPSAPREAGLALAVALLLGLLAAGWAITDALTSSPSATALAPPAAVQRPDAGSARAEATRPPSAPDEPLRLRSIPPELLRDDILSRDDVDGLVRGPGEPLLEAGVAGEDPAARLSALDRALEADPSDVGSRAARATTLLALGREREGTALLLRLAREHPDDAEVQFELGALRTRQGRFEEAERAYTRALTAEPEHAAARARRGVLRARLGRTRDAYEDLRAALSADPNDARALAELSAIYLRADRSRDALPALRRLVRISPTDATAWASLSSVLTSSPDADEQAEAITAVERALALEPGHVAAVRQRCVLFARLERAGAVPACDEAIQAIPTDADLFMARGVELARQESLRPAIADATRAVELAPDTPRHYTRRATLLRRAGDRAGAERDLRAACELGDASACRALEQAGLAP